MADVELLPLPEPEMLHVGGSSGWFTADQMRAYARANLAPLQAEIERLRAEVDKRQALCEALTAALSSAEKSIERIRFLESARAERLAEALRGARARTADLAAWLKSGNDVPADLPFVFRERWQKIAADIRALEAALAQEDRNG